MLDTNTAEAAVMALLEDQATRLDNPTKARMDFARDIVAAFAALIRSGTVTGTVNTTGTAAAQAGPLLNGTIS